MKLLVLGGTIFLGRHIVESALQRGHEVTLFNRGQHNTELFPHVEQLRGDRGGDLSSLDGHRWDAVIDTSGYLPRLVRKSATMLTDKSDHYTFISSISVYGELDTPGIDENSPVGRLDDPTVEEVTGETYGPLKALCEQAAESAMPGRVLTIRPGLIVGPHDATDRFTYWPHRMARGGEVLAPGRRDHPVQIIDVRDLAAWTLDMVEQRQTGIYNATGPDYELTLGRVLEAARAVGNIDATIEWVSEEFLLKHNVAPWADLPLWLPRDLWGMAQVDVSKAIGSGLSFHPIERTLHDTLAWAQTRDPNQPLATGITPEREAQLLGDWREAQSRA